MMTPEEHIARHLTPVTLTEQERSAMRARLRAYVHLHPVLEPRSVRMIRWIIRHGVAAVLLSFLLVAGGVGVSAEFSRPGDALYGFRLLVNDRIQMALAAGEDGRIDVEMLQLQRMIDDEEFFRDDILGTLAYQDASDTDNVLRKELDTVERQLRVFDDGEKAAIDEFERELSEMESELRRLEQRGLELE